LPPRRCIGGQGALAPRGAGGWGFCLARPKGRRAPLVPAGIAPEVAAGRGGALASAASRVRVLWPPGCPMVAAPLGAKALWPPLSCSGNCPAHPPPRKDGQAAGRVGGRDLSLEQRTCGQGALARASHNSCAQDIGRHMPLGKKLRFPMRLLAARVALLLEVAWLPKHVGRRRGSSGEVCPPTRPSRERRAALACELMCSDYMHSACV
jgi:hypothetical protein